MPCTLPVHRFRAQNGRAEEAEKIVATRPARTRSGVLDRWLRGDWLRQTFAALEGAISRAAASAAHTSMRIASVSREIHRTHEALGEMLRSAEGLSGDMQRISSASQQTATAARQMKDVAAEALGASDKGANSARELQGQMAETVKRIDALLSRVQAVMEASRVIDDIAQQTQLLAFNASIEAARAGDHGRGFAIVAREVGTLAASSEERTREINQLLRAIREELAPTRTAMSRSASLVESASHDARETGEAMRRLNKLADDVFAHMDSISGAARQQGEGIQDVFDRLKAASRAAQAISSDAEAMTRATFALSALTEETFPHFEAVDTGNTFHRALALGRELASRSARIFERAVDSGRCSLADVLAFEYREIRGSDIASLSHLFDVSRVPYEGFTPPKYHTRYDAVVDEELMREMDAIKAREPALIFALVIDLNAYGPIHNRDFCKDWTGDPAQDLAGNRVKRFFTDNRVLVRGARVGLSGADTLPDRATRAQLEAAGAGDPDRQGRPEDFLVQTYARDTGAILSAITAPIFVQGRRWGAVLLGWNVG